MVSECSVVQPTLGYHITNRQSRYITPARLKSGVYSSCIQTSIQMHKTPKHTTHKNVQEPQDNTHLQEHTHSEPHTTHNIGTALTTKTKLNSVALVRTRTIPTERPPPVGEVSANFLRIEGCHVVRRNGSPQPLIYCFLDPEPLLFFSFK